MEAQLKKEIATAEATLVKIENPEESKAFGPAKFKNVRPKLKVQQPTSVFAP